MTTQSSPADLPQNPAPSWTPEKQRTFLKALRPVIWVRINEVKQGDWAIGG